MEFDNAYYDFGFTLDCESEQEALDLLGQANAVLYLELLQYVKSKSLSILSFLRLIKVKLQRNMSSHCIRLPTIMEPKNRNLLKISRMIDENKIDRSTIEAHPIYNHFYYNELVEALKLLA